MIENNFQTKSFGNLATDLAVRVVELYAKILGDGKPPIIADAHRDLLVESLEMLSIDRGPDAMLSARLGLPNVATRREIVMMMRGRLGLRPPSVDCFADAVR